MPDRRRVRVLFLCLGNICRSPLAEAVFRRKVEAAGLADRFEIDSAGIGTWHVGEPPDTRMRATARLRGTDLGALRARQITPEDLRRYDHIFAMDRSVLHDALFLDPSGGHSARISLFREFDPEPADFQVPDPYYGGPDGFDVVYDIVERTAEALLERLRAMHRL